MVELQNNQTPARQTVPSAQTQETAPSLSSGASFSAPAYQLEGQLTPSSNPILGTAEERRLSVQYELIAHGFAYSTSLQGPQQTLAQAMGFQPQWARTSNFSASTGQAEDENANTGFFAGLLLPASNGMPANDEFSLDDTPATATESPNPVLAFRGSETGDQFTLDWYNNDMDPIAVGYTAFMLNYDKVGQLLAEAVQSTGKRVVVTGHSLGGSLAKQAALHFPQFISGCYTYQAPGISEAQQAYLENNMNAQGNVNGDQMSKADRAALSGFSDVDAHGFDDIFFEAHTGEGDIVNYAGGGRIPGTRRIKHDPSGITGLTPIAHTAFLTSSPEYQAEQDALHARMAAADPSYSGTRDELFSSSQGNRTGATTIDIDNPARITEDTVHMSIESARDALIAEMFNPHSTLINNFPERISGIPLASRTIILQSLLNGPGVIESLTKGAGVGMGIAAFLAAPMTVLGMAGGALAGFSEYGGDSTAGTVASTAGGAVAGGVVGGAADGLLNLVPILGPAKGLVAAAAPVAGVLGGLAYSYFALSNDVNETQEAAFKILSYSSPSDQKAMIQGIGGATMFYHKMDTIVNDFFGSDVFDRTRSEMTKSGGYFANLSATEGAKEITDNLNGGFLGFGDDTQEKLIADVLVYGMVGNDILTIVGGGDYNEGLKIVLRKLQGREDDMVSEKYDFTDGSWRWFS